jgi:hypothetical protein
MAKGLKNHVMTFAEFIDFSQEFELSKRNQNLIVFHIISDHRKILKILRLLKIFVTTPKGCPFSIELNKILEYYVMKSLINKSDSEKEEYDKALYNKLIPYSILCHELKNLFLALPKLAFLENGEYNPKFDSKDASLKESCLFAQKGAYV